MLDRLVDGIHAVRGGTLLLDNTAAANNTNRLRDASTLTLSRRHTRPFQRRRQRRLRRERGAVSVTQGANTISASPAAALQTSRSASPPSPAPAARSTSPREGLGASDQNRIFITGQSDGLIGTWATVNGTSYAAYSSAAGVYASGLTVTNIAAQGPDADSVIPDSASADVHITTPGTEGPVTLAGASVNSIFSLQQDSATTSTVDTAGKTLRAAQIAVSAARPT
jgi:hypothetical protein